MENGIDLKGKVAKKSSFGIEVEVLVELKPEIFPCIPTTSADVQLSAPEAVVGSGSSNEWWSFYHLPPVASAGFRQKPTLMGSSSGSPTILPRACSTWFRDATGSMGSHWVSAMLWVS